MATHNFTLAGILKYTGNFHKPLIAAINGNSKIMNPQNDAVDKRERSEDLNEHQDIMSAQQQEVADDIGQQGRDPDEQQGTADDTVQLAEASARPQEDADDTLDLDEASEQPQEDVDDTIADEHDDAGDDEVDEEIRGRHQLELKLARAWKALRDLHSIILDLENHPTCAATRIHHGTIHRDGASCDAPLAQP
ncbi:hypothetical protein ANCDUO_03721 [Ancylostoma duodenale]|uniref:Uncharacterized protein n=1 Tax=Ancylostoma duodenale TaxID=51022 RepID=A0A0C2H8T6_9BILA|nr:hypothetical protein ANCDUO_03721 [Ancylostoma duodenale]